MQENRKTPYIASERVSQYNVDRVQTMTNMKIYEKKAKRNIEYAQRWLNRATRDFNTFKRLVPFDKKTNKPVRCSDPPLAVYLLQQSVEKAVKAAAIASGQYKARDFIHYYSHNSLALIVNLYNKVIDQIQALGMEIVANVIGIDLGDGESKLRRLEDQIMGVTPLLDKHGKKVDFRLESIRITPQVIDQILDMVIQIRSRTLDTIRTAFSVLPKLGIHKRQTTITDTEEFVRTLSNLVAADLGVGSLSEEQIKAAIEFIQRLTSSNPDIMDKLQRRETIMNYLGVWALSAALLFLTYLTFAHESTSRYPLKHRGNMKRGRIGCDDYDENLGIVNRIAKAGYVTNLMLNDMRNEIDNIALFFAAGQD
jgi:HEPN domain-containing protein